MQDLGPAARAWLGRGGGGRSGGPLGAVRGGAAGAGRALAHVGVVLCAVGITGTGVWGEEAAATLAPGESVPSRGAW
jgi:cytochrome c biogenesis factor